MKAGKWEKKKFEGRELAGKTLGVVGLGNIGRIVADRARGLRMNVIGFDPCSRRSAPPRSGIELVSIDELFARADAITVHTPLTADTQGPRERTRRSPKMKKGVLLVNAARGGIYDEAALLEGLTSGQDWRRRARRLRRGAAAEGHPAPPARAASMVTPHLGASTKEAQDRVALEIAEQVVAYLANGAIKNAVNVASVSSEIAPQARALRDARRPAGPLPRPGGAARRAPARSRSSASASRPSSGRRRSRRAPSPGSSTATSRRP